MLLISLYYQNKNINLKKYTTPSFMLTQSSDVHNKKLTKKRSTYTVKNRKNKIN